jgi:hypothetical protein
MDRRLRVLLGLALACAPAMPARAGVRFLTPVQGSVYPWGSAQTIVWQVDNPTGEWVRLCQYGGSGGFTRELAVVPLASGSYSFRVEEFGHSDWNELELVPPGRPCSFDNVGLVSLAWTSFRVSLDGVPHVRLQPRFSQPAQASARWGETVEFDLRVTNSGPLPSLGASVSVAPSPGLEVLGWRCTAPAGSRCAPAGAGAVDPSADVASQATVAYTFRARVLASAMDEVKLEARAVAGANAPDPFAATAAATARVTVRDARVVSPNGGEISTPGASRTLRWRMSGAGGPLALSLVQGSAVTPIASFYATWGAEGTHTFMVPSTPGPARVALLYNGVFHDESDADFYVVDPAAPPKPLDLNSDVCW